MKIIKKVLPNKLRLVFIPRQEVASVTASVFVGAGSRYERWEQSGISHFLEHMFFKGTEERPSALEISTLIDGIGGDFNAMTSEETTAYYIKASRRHFDLIMDVLADILKSSLFDKEEIEREKGVILEELKMIEDTPQRKIHDIFKGLAFGDQPVGWDVGGRKEIIAKLEREDFLKFMETYYHPSKMVVSIAGNVSEKEAYDMVNRLFGSISDKDSPTFQKAQIDQQKPRLRVRFKETDQAHLCLGFPSFELSHPKRYSVKLLNVILGGGMSSRLFINVRERRGLAYYIRSHNDPYLDTGLFYASAGVDIRRIKEAIKVILEELSRISQEKVGVKELQKAKEYLKGRFDLFWEDTRSVSLEYGDEEILEEKIIQPEEYKKLVDQVKGEDVLEVAQEIFDQRKLNLAMVGPFKDGDEFFPLLKF